MDTKTSWHALSTDEAIAKLQATPEGLTKDEAVRRLAEHGPNELTSSHQENLDKVGTMLARAGFVVVAMILAIGLFRGQPFIEMLIFGIALAVAVVPEALPAVVTISLAIGGDRQAEGFISPVNMEPE